MLYIPAAAGAARKGLGGSVVVSDTYNHRLKLVDPRKKAVVTLAGTGTHHAVLGVVREQYTSFLSCDAH